MWPAEVVQNGKTFTLAFLRSKARPKCRKCEKSSLEHTHIHRHWTTVRISGALTLNRHMLNELGLVRLHEPQIQLAKLERQFDVRLSECAPRHQRHSAPLMYASEACPLKLPHKSIPLQVDVKWGRKVPKCHENGNKTIILIYKKGCTNNETF